LTNSLVRLEKHGAISIVSLDNPPVNAASTKLMNALHERLDEIELDKETRCVILTGAGTKAFCAGGDLREEKDFGTPEGSKAFQELGRKTLNRLENFPLPIIAAIHGYCIGGGTAIGWACDIRIAADDTVFRAADAYIGMVPSLGHGFDAAAALRRSQPCARYFAAGPRLRRQDGLRFRPRDQGRLESDLMRKR